MKSHSISLTSYRGACAAFALIAAAACSDSTGPAAVVLGSPDSRIQINNDEASLGARVRYTGGQDVPIDPAGTSSKFADMLSVAPTSVAFALEAVVAPPVVNGQVLQASHVTIDGHFAYVSYMTYGEVWLGAVEVFDIEKPDQPKLVSQAVVRGTDVAGLAVDGGYVYLATSTGDSSFAEHAVLERVMLKKNLLTSVSTRIGMPSYVATGVDIAGNRVYVTSGTGGPRMGGLTILDTRTLLPVSTDVFADARAVSAVSAKFIAVAQGSPAKLRLYDVKSGALMSSVSLSGGSTPDAKSSVIMTDDWGFVATGEGGMQLVDLAKGAVSASHNRPSVPGVDPSDAMTNSVSLSKELVLTADGGAGITVSYSDYAKRKSGETPTLNALGRLALPGSANAVASNDQTLFVANGTGGLQILSIKTK